MHPYRGEWLRYCNDSPVTGTLREKPHIAFKVDNIERVSKGLKVLIEPFASVASHVMGFFDTADGAVIELVEYDE